MENFTEKAYVFKEEYLQVNTEQYPVYNTIFYGTEALPCGFLRFGCTWIILNAKIQKGFWFDSCLCSAL